MIIKNNNIFLKYTYLNIIDINTNEYDRYKFFK